MSSNVNSEYHLLDNWLHEKPLKIESSLHQMGHFIELIKVISPLIF